MRLSARVCSAQDSLRCRSLAPTLVLHAFARFVPHSASSCIRCLTTTSISRCVIFSCLLLSMRVGCVPTQQMGLLAFSLVLLVAVASVVAYIPQTFEVDIGDWDATTPVTRVASGGGVLGVPSGHVCRVLPLAAPPRRANRRAPSGTATHCMFGKCVCACVGCISR